MVLRLPFMVRRAGDMVSVARHYPLQLVLCACPQQQRDNLLCAIVATRVVPEVEILPEG
jgi:hypothetical protein